jgi:hypothetical protein
MRLKSNLALVCLLVLSACSKTDLIDPAHCNEMKITDLTADQIRAVASLCGKQPAPTVRTVVVAPPVKTISQEMVEGARDTGMPVDRFMASEAGRVVVAKHYAPMIVGLAMMAFIWLTVALVLRYSVRVPVKAELRKGLLRRRYVVTEYRGEKVDGWFATLLLAIGAGYSAAVYFGVIGWP